jgi:hypothetical protein
LDRQNTSAAGAGRGAGRAPLAAHVGPLYLAVHSQRKAGVHSAGHTSLTRVPVGDKTKGIVSKFAVNLMWVV